MSCLAARSGSVVLVVRFQMMKIDENDINNENDISFAYT